MGMSATMPNARMVADWLGGRLYETTFSAPCRSPSTSRCILPRSRLRGGLALVEIGGLDQTASFMVADGLPLASPWSFRGWARTQPAIRQQAPWMGFTLQ